MNVAKELLRISKELIAKTSSYIEVNRSGGGRVGVVLYHGSSDSNQSLGDIVSYGKYVERMSKEVQKILSDYVMDGLIESNVGYESNGNIGITAVKIMSWDMDDADYNEVKKILYAKRW